MNSLKNWDNNTWLSSKKYINTFNNFLKSKVKLNKNSKILDVGCGRANIISYLHKQYKFNIKPIGLDVVRNKNIKSNIMFKKIDAIVKPLDINFSTSRLTEILQKIISKHPPKIINGRRIKLRYMHLGDTSPIRFIIHGNQTKNVPGSYKRYLTKALRKRLKILGTPVLIEFKQNKNPYIADRKVAKRSNSRKHSRSR